MTPVSTKRAPWCLAAAALGVSCGPMVVMTTSDPSGGPRKLEVDEAEVRCAGGDSCACHALGVFQTEQGNAKTGRVSLERGCNLACVPACAELSEAWFDGHGGEPRDVALGTRFAIRACKLDPARCAAPGERFERGLGVTRDLERAGLFYGEGCKKGIAESCAGVERTRNQK